MKNNDSGLVYFFTAIVYVFGAIGEIACIVKFFSCDFDVPLKAEFIYGLSAITGLGAITGWFNFGK